MHIDPGLWLDETEIDAWIDGLILNDLAHLRFLTGI